MMLSNILINIFLITICVVIHFEAFHILTNLNPKIKIKPRLKVLLGVIVALLAHTIEIWIYGLTYYFLHFDPSMGSFKGEFNGELLDCVYFSFSSYNLLRL